MYVNHKLSLHHGMKTYGRVEIKLHAFWNTALDVSGQFQWKSSPDIHWIGGLWTPNTVWTLWQKIKAPAFSGQLTLVVQPAIIFTVREFWMSDTHRFHWHIDGCLIRIRLVTDWKLLTSTVRNEFKYQLNASRRDELLSGCNRLLRGRYFDGVVQTCLPR